MWTTHPDTGFVIEAAWNWERHFGARLKHTKIALQLWNKEVFGHVQSRIHQVREVINHLQLQT